MSDIGTGSVDSPPRFLPHLALARCTSDSLRNTTVPCVVFRILYSSAFRSTVLSEHPKIRAASTLVIHFGILLSDLSDMFSSLHATVTKEEAKTLMKLLGLEITRRQKSDSKELVKAQDASVGRVGTPPAPSLQEMYPRGSLGGKHYNPKPGEVQVAAQFTCLHRQWDKKDF